MSFIFTHPPEGTGVRLNLAVTLRCQLVYYVQRAHSVRLSLPWF